MDRPLDEALSTGPMSSVSIVVRHRGAEPIAVAYERGLVHHVGIFAKLEDQLCALTPDFEARSAGFSPDRADALVWAVADLIDIDGRKRSGMMDFWRAEAGKK